MLKSVTFRLCCVALLSALSIVCNVYSITITPQNSISFVYIVAFMSGVFLGPVEGFAVGAIGDVIGCIISPKGPYAISVTLSSALMGVLFWAIFKMCKKMPVYGRIILGYLLVFIVCSVLINTTTWYLIGSRESNYFVFLGTRNAFQSIIVAVNCLLTCLLYKSMSMIMGRFGFKPQTKKDKKADESTEAN